MHVRPATTSDLPGILAIYNDAVLHTTATYDEQEETLERRVLWWEDHQRHGYPVWVAEGAGGEIVGWSSLSRFHSKPGYRHTAENSVYVSASHRSRGIGKLLMEPLIAGARARGCHAILALIDAENSASLRLHRGFGFVEVGHLREVGFKFGRWLDVVYMQRLLP